MLKPNFLIIGAPKAGTTSLYKYLSQHHDIGFSKLKEPKYFSFKDTALDFVGNQTVINQIKKSTIQDFDVYQDLFKHLNTRFVGEASPNYLHVPQSAKNIFDYNPDMKLIVILRNPIDKTYSDWKHNYAMGYEPVKNFKKALSMIEGRKAKNSAPYFDYLEKGKFALHLKRYLKYFKKEQIKILFFDDFKIDPNRTCNEVIKFLGIQEPYQFATEKIHMKAKTLYKSKHLKKVSNALGSYVSPKLMTFMDSLNEIDSNLSRVDRAFLKSYFIEDIKELETITQRDLSGWLKSDN